MLDSLPRWGRFGVLFALGVAAGLGQAPLDLWPASILALAMLLVLHRDSVTARVAGWRLWFFGLGYFAFTLRWIVEPFLVDAPRHGWMAPFALVFMACGAALFWAVAGWVATRIAPRSQVMLALLLVAVEMTRSLVLTGFPWALLGHIWVPTWLAQASAIGGPHLLTGITLIAALALARIARRAFWSGGAAMLALLLVAAALRPGPAPQIAADAPIVRLVQPNAPQHLKWDPAYRDAFVNRLVTLSGQAAPPDLIVWPETAVPYLLNEIIDDLRLLDEAARGAPLVFGVQRVDGAGRFYNALVVMEQGGRITATYDKQHLVPFGEYIPFGDLLGRFGLRGLAATDGGGFAPGTTAGPVAIPGIGLAVPLICYEGIFAEEILTGPDRPRLLLLITNDGWFGEAAGPHQHLAQARLRAIEQGLPMVRVANTGISAMIDAQGRITASLALGADGVLDAALPAIRAAPPYTRLGDWPVGLLVLLGMAICIINRKRDSD
ncbi:apolipoprotein N-acyltransferase [Yoonia vestfoldensis]|jgi:apolipoprotein N-acyltransferase|uniref:Apolipoprotein N-acyltransferase n=1 Tax=Yoonia vestfoldensis TaxID=245188 RepID=A0A1Y0EDI9_9RHOB|nr:apolipoprotein N-acyltransferase [Yoonia vestfoldensis]ARU01528.1 apolipoprotein N-acyltransferase [Yoonia vestfoldensis]